MFFANALVIAKPSKTILCGLTFLGVIVALFLTQKTVPSEEETSSEDETSCATLGGFGKPVNALAFSPDGKILASGDGWIDGTGEVKLWDVNAGTEPVSLGRYPNAIQSLAFNPVGRTLAIGCFDGTVTLWDILRSQNSHVFRISDRCPYKAVFSPDGRTLATWGADACLRLHDLSTGEEQTIQGVTGPVAFCPDVQHLAAVRYDKLTVRNALNGALLISDWRTYVLWTLVFSPDGRSVAAATQEGKVTLWDGNSGEERIKLMGYQDRVNVLAFSADGRYLASGDFIGTVKLWAVTTGEELACLRGHTRAVSALAFAPDGLSIASGSHDQTVKIWRFDGVTKRISR